MQLHAPPPPLQLCVHTPGRLCIDLALHGAGRPNHSDIAMSTTVVNPMPLAATAARHRDLLQTQTWSASAGPPPMGCVKREAGPRLRLGQPPPNGLGRPPPVGLWGCGPKSLAFHWLSQQNCKSKARQRSRLVCGQGLDPTHWGGGRPGRSIGQGSSSVKAGPNPLGGGGQGARRNHR